LRAVLPSATARSVPFGGNADRDNCRGVGLWRKALKIWERPGSLELDVFMNECFCKQGVLYRVTRVRSHKKIVRNEMSPGITVTLADGFPRQFGFPQIFQELKSIFQGKAFEHDNRFMWSQCDDADDPESPELKWSRTLVWWASWFANKMDLLDNNPADCSKIEELQFNTHDICALLGDEDFARQISDGPHFH
jgi:hypothetical protein